MSYDVVVALVTQLRPLRSVVAKDVVIFKALREVSFTLR